MYKCTDAYKDGKDGDRKVADDYDLCKVCRTREQQDTTTHRTTAASWPNKHS